MVRTRASEVGNGGDEEAAEGEEERKREERFAEQRREKQRAESGVGNTDPRRVLIWVCTDKVLKRCSATAAIKPVGFNCHFTLYDWSLLPHYASQTLSLRPAAAIAMDAERRADGPIARRDRLICAGVCEGRGE